MALACPACRSELYEIEDGGVHVDRCPSCSGVWLDGRELTRVIEGRGRSFPPDVVEQLRAALTAERRGYVHHGPGERLCPRCNLPLRAFNYAYSTGVIVDRCPACKGVWTDYGELEQIEILMSQGGAWSQLMDKTLDDCPATPFGPAVVDDPSPLSMLSGRGYGGFFWFLRLFSRP